MPDQLDYMEPACPLCEGKDFYAPKEDAPRGRIPVMRVIDKTDALFHQKKTEEAGRILLYWRSEAVSLGDKNGELSMENELVGYYRKQNEREEALRSASRALLLVSELGQDAYAAGATVYLNCATAYKAFGKAREALPLYARAEEIYRRVLPANDARFGGLYNNMALALSDLGDYEAAERAYLSALDIMKNVAGGEAESAITYINLAHMYENAEKEEKIKECMDKAYFLLKSENLRHDGYYAFVLEKCAPSFGYFGNTAAYTEFEKEAAAIYERA